MLGADLPSVGWPQCGEIDIMENIGKEPSTIHGSLHAPGADLSGAYTLGSREFYKRFHVFGAEWDTTRISFYVDDEESPYYVVERTDFPGVWVFDHPFYILLNVAVGGLWPGNPGSSTHFPQAMEVDYVRVYQRAS
jgi:beta-glucanase (GH16 family)